MHWMPTPGDALAAALHAARDDIASTWQRAVIAHVPALLQHERAVILDHLPALFDGIGAWVDDDEARARPTLDEFAARHALSRDSEGIPIDALAAEYQLLRTAILSTPALPGGSAAWLRIDAALDATLVEAVRRHAELQDRARERVLGMLGHDLRNPLASIALAAGDLLTSPCTEPLHRRRAAMIERGASRMRRMITDLTDFARTRLGCGIPMVPAPCDMSAICEEAAEELRLAHPGRTITVETTGELVGLWDRDRVLQVVSNLIANGIEHGEDPIEVRAEATDDGAHVRTSVTSHGPAIPGEQLGRLFEAFYVAEGTSQRPTHLGLGLFIVDEIARAHGARVTVRSDAGVTVFDVAWPRGGQPPQR